MIPRRINVAKIGANFKIIYPFSHFSLSNIKGGYKSVLHKYINNMVWCTNTDLSRRNVTITKEGWEREMGLADIINKVNPIKPMDWLKIGAQNWLQSFLQVTWRGTHDGLWFGVLQMKTKLLFQRDKMIFYLKLRETFSFGKVN